MKIEDILHHMKDGYKILHQDYEQSIIYTKENDEISSEEIEPEELKGKEVNVVFIEEVVYERKD